MFRKVAFTLVEIMIIVILISMFFLMFQRFLASDQKDLLTSKSCINYLYWEIGNYLNYAMSWKWLYINNGWLSPDIYSIKFDAINDKLTLAYSWSSWVGTYKDINLRWTTEFGSVNCFDNKSSYINMKWDDLQIDMSKMFQWTINNQSFLINNTKSILTWEVVLEHCDNLNNCIEIVKFFIDRRVNDIRNVKCLHQNDGKLCTMRSE